VTITESCDLLTYWIMQTRAARRQRDGWRLTALVALQRLTDVQRELEMVAPDGRIYRKIVRQTEDDIARMYDTEIAIQEAVTAQGAPA
jgi:hypothetical protein